MRIGFTDPQGRRFWRALPYVLPVALLGSAFLPQLTGHVAAAMVFFSFTTFHLAGLLPWRQRTTRNAELVCGPGYIDIKKAGSRNQRIRAKDITGGTSARTKNGFVFTIQHRKRDQPITLEIENEEELAKVRHALGVGHGGFGTVAWGTQSDSNTRTAFTGRAIAFVCALLMTLLTLAFRGDEGAVGFDILLGMVGGVGALLGFVGLASRSPDPTVLMAWDGLKLLTPRGWFSLPYNMLASIEEQPRNLVFHLAPPHPPVAVERGSALVHGLSDADQKTLMAQINSSAQRARGLGPQKEDVRGRVDALRRNGESPRAWLTRLDMAGQMLSSGPGYRGHTLDVEDLWAILEDPEAEPELRGAAARVLKHSPAPETRTRIDTAVAAVREESVNKRLRIAIEDDVDQAANLLATIEAEEQVLKHGYHVGARGRRTP